MAHLQKSSPSKPSQSSPPTNNPAPATKVHPASSSRKGSRANKDDAPIESKSSPPRTQITRLKLTLSNIATSPSMEPISSRSQSSSSSVDATYSIASSSKPRRILAEIDPAQQQRPTSARRPVDTPKRTHTERTHIERTHTEMLSGDNTHHKFDKKHKKDKRHKIGHQELGTTPSTILSPADSNPEASAAPDMSVAKSVVSRASRTLSKPNSDQGHPNLERHRGLSNSMSTSPTSSPTKASTPFPPLVSNNGTASGGPNDRGPSAPSFPPSPKNASPPPSSTTPPLGTAASASLLTSQTLVSASSSSSSTASGSRSAAPLASNILGGFLLARLQINKPSVESSSHVFIASTATVKGKSKSAKGHGLSAQHKGLSARSALAQPAAASLCPTISLERPESRELKRRQRPDEELAMDVLCVAKRRHSSGKDELDTTSTIHPQANLNAGPSHHPAKPVCAISTSNGSPRTLTAHEAQMLQHLKTTAQEKQVPYTSWTEAEPALVEDTAQGHFKPTYHVQDDKGVVVQRFKDMDAKSFEGRVREVACLFRLQGLEGAGQIKSVIDDSEDHLVGLSMTKYTYTLKDDQNVMVEEDPRQKLADGLLRPLVRVIDFGKSVFINPEDVKRWSIKEEVSNEGLTLLPLVILPPDHGYMLYRSILTLPRSKHDHKPLPPVDPLAEDVYSLGVLNWRTLGGMIPWSGAIDDDPKTIRDLVRNDEQIKFNVEKEVKGPRSRELLRLCLTAKANTRSTVHKLKAWLDQPEISADLLKEFESCRGVRMKVRKNRD
ncbi:hypothetical protein BGX29_005492 [Mortierella sp. GBA35]|nr:hypothetical protein BGX29_005492 [Mortierella sp. GBA35]